MSEEAVGSDPRPRLGRGLAALLGAAKEDARGDASQNGAQRVPIEFLRPNPKNPRRIFDEDELNELAQSIRQRGVIQPILVRPLQNSPGAYEIVAGERRWRAGQRAELDQVPVIVLEVGDREALEIAIVENVQRADLNPLEEAAGFAQLGSEYGYSQEQIANVVGKSRSHIANTLRLVNLPDQSRQLLVEGKITAGHARALLSLSDPDTVAKRIVQNNLTVRDIERLAQADHKKPRQQRSRQPSDPDTIALQEQIQMSLGTPVLIKRSGEGGELRISFRDFDQLDDLRRKLMAGGSGQRGLDPL